MKHEIEELAKISLRQAKLLSVLSQYILDQACLMETLLVKCDKCNERAVTVKHQVHGEACDRCAAEISYKNMSLVTPVFEEPSLIIVKEQLDDWRDIELADNIRRMIDYITNAKALYDIQQHGDTH